jgi:hypothetical protein
MRDYLKSSDNFVDLEIENESDKGILSFLSGAALSFDNIEMMRQEQSLHQMLLFYPLIH